LTEPAKGAAEAPAEQEPPAGPTFEHPSQTPYFHALERDRYRRQEQIRAIEAHTNRRLICFVSNPYAEITRNIITVFADLLDDIKKGDDLDLLLNTPGGDIDAAEKLVIMCRSRCEGFRIIVPESAKSAGTMMCCAADSIVMGFASDLGPIDPQIFVPDSSGQQISRPAHSFLAGFDEIKDAAQKAGELSPAYFPLLDKLDPALLEFCRTSIKRAEQFAGNWLKRHQCKDNEEKAEKIAAHLGDINRFRSHGAAINAKEALEIGLEVEELEPDDPLWEAIWRIWCEYDLALRQGKWGYISRAAAPRSCGDFRRRERYATSGSRPGTRGFRPERTLRRQAPSRRRGGRG